MKAARGAKNGFAMLAALWLIATAALLGTGVMLALRTSVLEASNAADAARARAAAVAGVAVALSDLNRQGWQAVGIETRAMPEAALPSAGGAARDSVTIQAATWFRVRVKDASAGLPINVASQRELQTLFQSLGCSDVAAETAAESILDWRDPDDLHRAHGAEWPDYYRHLPDAIHPRNGPLESLSELAHVRGVGPSLLARARLYLSIGGSQQVNLNAAPVPVLRALPGLSDEAISYILLHRRAGQPIRSLLNLESVLSAPARAELQRSFAKLSALATFEPSAVRIESTGWTSSRHPVVHIVALAVPAGDRFAISWKVEE